MNGNTQMPFPPEKIAPEWNIKRTVVKSAQLLSVGYDDRALVLEVEFQKGAVYRYHDVPPEVHHQLVIAESIGAFFNAHIKAKPAEYRCHKVDVATGLEETTSVDRKPATAAQRDYVYRLLGQVKIIEGFRSERCSGAMVELVREISGPELRDANGLRLVDDWINALTSAQAAKAIEWLKEHRP